MRRPWRIAAALVFVSVVVASGLFGDRVLAVNDETRERLRLFTELVAAAHDHYATPVPYEDVVNASIQGMIRTLDPHTAFLTADAYDAMRDKQESTFSGLGILVGIRDSKLTVITPLEGTPASRMGMRAGDVISTIEGEPTETLSIDEAVRRLKGPKGTSVTIEVARRGMPDLLELEIVREEIPQTSVRYAYLLKPDVGYISLTDFNRGTGPEMERTLERLRSQGMKRLLLDLRANGGGLLDQAIAVANLFVPAGNKIVETRGRTRESFQDFHAAADRQAPAVPLVVLVGDGTASAAEIVAGAIQDHDLGVVVGTPTWGKGLVQTVYALGYGNGLSVTTAKYYTPSGRLIQRDFSDWFHYQYDERAPTPPAASEQGTFYTDLGRKVYGGGGINPDVVVDQEELAPILQYLLARNTFFNFAVEEANREHLPDRSWRPDDATFERFRRWLLSQQIVEVEDLEKGLAEADNREVAMRYLAAEFLGAEFGLEARHQVLVTADRQVEAALAQFEVAASLLAQRQRLQDEPLAGTAVGSLN